MSKSNSNTNDSNNSKIYKSNLTPDNKVILSHRERSIAMRHLPELLQPIIKEVNDKNYKSYITFTSYTSASSL